MYRSSKVSLFFVIVLLTGCVLHLNLLRIFGIESNTFDDRKGTAILQSSVVIDACAARDPPSSKFALLQQNRMDFNETQSMLRRTSPIRIALNGANSLENGSFSRWQCVGGLEDVGVTKDRACVFSNVCLDTRSRAQEFVFFRREGAAFAPVIYDHRQGRQWSFQQGSSGFVNLGGARKTWAPRVELGPLPQHRYNFMGLSALSAPSIGRFNVGHTAFEDAFPLVVAMAQLGIYTPYLRIIRTHSCDIMHRNGPPWLSQQQLKEVCHKLESAFLKPLSDLEDADERLKTLSELVKDHSNFKWLCFEQLLVGGTFQAFTNEDLNKGKEPLLHLFRHRVLTWHGVDPTSTPSKHQIVFVQKRGRRAILNLDEVSSYTASRFGVFARICKSDLAQMTFAQQFQLLVETTIAVSPCGGISMVLPFLPDGAYAVLVNYMRAFSIWDLFFQRREEHGECSGCSWTMEAELWRHVRHVNKMYYQVWRSSDFEAGRPGRDSAVRVEPERLASLIESALHDMEPY